MRRPRRLAGIVCALQALSASTVASGDEATFAWRAPAGCAGKATVDAELTTLLGRPLTEAAPPSFRARALVERRAAASWHLRLEIEDETSDSAPRIAVRDLHGETCASVERAALIVIGLAVDPDAVAERLADPSATADPAPAFSDADAAVEQAPSPPPLPAPSDDDVAAEQTSPPPAAAPPPTGVPSRPSAAHDAPTLAVSARLGAEGGVLPGVGVGAGGAAAVSVGRFRLALSADYWPTRTEIIPGRPGAGGEFDLAAAGLSACYALVPRRITVSACAGADLGVMSGSAFGIRAPSDGAGAWIAVTVGLAASRALTKRFAVALAVIGVAPISFPRFDVEGYGAVYEPAPVALRVILGVEARLD